MHGLEHLQYLARRAPVEIVDVEHHTVGNLGIGRGRGLWVDSFPVVLTDFALQLEQVRPDRRQQAKSPPVVHASDICELDEDPPRCQRCDFGFDGLRLCPLRRNLGSLSGKLNLDLPKLGLRISKCCLRSLQRSLKPSAHLGL